MKKKAVLLVNLGSPDSPSEPDVRRYLREFLMDGRVLDAPWPIRFGVVHFSILPKRPRDSAHAYRSIWTDEGSPLIAISRRVQAALRERLNIPVELAMRYQNPSISAALERLAAERVDELLVIPLFPHYAMSSYETAVERVRELVRKIAPNLPLHIQKPYYNLAVYIDALVASATPCLQEGFDHLLFSFHGLPERHLRKADPTGCHCLRISNCCEIPSPARETCYRTQCIQTMKSFLAESRIPQDKCSIAFQSRLGREPWMKPYTDVEIARLARSGVRRLLVICPAFVSDCLETLEEIGIRGRDIFYEAGGEKFTLIPCLNDHPEWIRALEEMVKQRWPTAAVHDAVQDDLGSAFTNARRGAVH